jgi:hypothetical protein
MPVLLVILGIISATYGLLNVLGRTKQDLSKDSTIDKKLFSAYTRYFIGRYYAGIQFMLAGLGAIALGLIILFSH